MNDNRCKQLSIRRRRLVSRAFTMQQVDDRRPLFGSIRGGMTVEQLANNTTNVPPFLLITRLSDRSFAFSPERGRPGLGRVRQGAPRRDRPFWDARMLSRALAPIRLMKIH